MNNKIYISGRITGDPNYETKFESAEDIILRSSFWKRHGAMLWREGFFGFLIVNPVHLLDNIGVDMRRLPWWLCMVACVAAVCRCSTVYMLHDWRYSRGARIEHWVARHLGKHIIYQ